MRTHLVGGAAVAAWLIATGMLINACVQPSLREPFWHGDGGDSAEGGGGEAPYLPGRGDPADFPDVCYSDCTEACDKLDECGGEASELFPVDRAACLTRCGLQQQGPIWDDISHNFKCCASQTSCERVQHCGGWLDHPEAKSSCDQICECFFNSALAALYDGLSAPHGYRFADDVVMLELAPDAPPIGLPGARVERTGRFARVFLSSRSGPAALAQLASLGRLLPTVRDHQGRVGAVTGRVIAELPAPAHRSFADALANRRGATGTRELKIGNALRVIELPPFEALDAVRELAAAGIVAELDMVHEYVLRYVPDDPLFEDQWHLLNGGQGPSFSGVDGRVSEAWDLTLGVPAAIIAINDDGVDLHHGDFEGTLEAELNYPSDWETLMAMGNFGGHGTSVAGVSAAKADDALGGSGVCPGCRILPHRLGESNFTSFQLTNLEIAEGFERQVDAGAWVSNNSWGYPTGQPTYVDAALPAPPLAGVVAAAFDYAETVGRGGLGTVIVFAAGNDNDALDAMGKHPTTVAVAAVGDNGLKSYYSSFGPEVDVAAPSNGAFAGITTSAAGGGHTDSFGGTSSASPFVAGVFGLVLSANPSLTAAEARDIVRQSATPIDPVFGDYVAGHSPYYGAGMVNAYVAVQMALGNCTTPSACLAPSDACGASCGTKTLCAPCRTQADCASEHVCQALPTIGASVCVPAVGAGCPAGTQPVNGYCLPSAQTCGMCSGAEECNGRDDDCDGETDEGGVCTGPAYCWIDGPSCPAGQACAGIRCTDTCQSDDDCGEAQMCKPLKNQFGASLSTVKGCVTNQQGSCQIGCSVLVSSVEDEQRAKFIECMMDGQVPCNQATSCALLLPITF